MEKNLLGSRYEKTTTPTIGNKYHLSWANHKCVWKLVELCADGKYCRLETPKTKKKILAKLEDLRLLSPEAFSYKPK